VSARARRGGIGRIVGAGSVAVLLIQSAVDAHGTGLGAQAIGEWTFEPVTVALLLVSLWVYAAGVLRLWDRAGRGRGLPTWRVVSFGAGVLAIAVALLSPVDWLAEQLFSAHMIQHELLMLVAAPLLVFGHPIIAALWAIPSSWRERAGRAAKRRSVARTWSALTSPATVFVLQLLALWVWHIPRLYEAALANGGIHALQHLSFLLTATLFWWAMMRGRFGGAGYGFSVAFVFLTAMHSSVLGALLTFAPSVLYPVYEGPGARWQVDPLADQQLAGLIMWIPFGVLFVAFGLGLFSAWLGESERRVARGTKGVGASATERRNAAGVDRPATPAAR
jgi:cytochrome c oxidase assembly factor CtaG